MGRIPGLNGPPKQALKILRGKHREIMRRLIAGEKQRTIAQDLGINECRLSIIVNSPLFKREYDKLEKEVRERYVEKTADVQEVVQKLQPNALNVLESIITQSKVDGLVVTLPLKRETALDILELGGNGKRKLGNGDGKKDSIDDAISIIRQGFSLAQEAVKERARREAPVNPGYIDVTPEEAGIERQTIQEKPSAMDVLHNIDEKAEDVNKDVNKDIDKKGEKTSISTSVKPNTQVEVNDAAVELAAAI